MLNFNWKLMMVMMSLNTGLAHSKPMPTPISVVHLYSACKAAHESEYARGFCDGAIVALYSSITDWCVPQRITHGEVREYISNELLGTKHPPKGSAYNYVNSVVKMNWPCSR